MVLSRDFGDTKLVTNILIPSSMHILKSSDILSKTNDLKVFGDLQVTTNYPYDGLEYISKDKTHDIHIMIQRNGSMKN